MENVPRSGKKFSIRKVSVSKRRRVDRTTNKISWTLPERIIDMINLTSVEATEQYGDGQETLLSSLENLTGFNHEKAAQYAHDAGHLISSYYTIISAFADIFPPRFPDYSEQIGQTLYFMKEYSNMAGEFIAKEEFNEIISREFSDYDLISVLKQQNVDIGEDPHSSREFEALQLITRNMRQYVGDTEHIDLFSWEKTILERLKQVAQLDQNIVRQFMTDFNKAGVSFPDRLKLGNTLELPGFRESMESIDAYVELTQTGMLKVAHAKATSSTPLYRTVHNVKASLDTIIGQDVTAHDLSSLLEHVHYNKLAVTLDLILENPEYLQNFNMFNTGNLSPSRYAQFLQQNGQKIVHGLKGDITAFEFVKDIALSGNIAPAKELIETHIDWTSYEHLAELYNVTRQQGSTLVVRAYLRYGAQNQPNKQRLILQAGNLKASTEELREIRLYMDREQDNALDTISNEIYGNIEALKEALSRAPNKYMDAPGEAEPNYSALPPISPLLELDSNSAKKKPSTHTKTQGYGIDEILSADGIDPNAVREADEYLQLLAIEGVWQHVDISKPESVNRFARYIKEEASSPHLPKVLGDPRLRTAYFTSFDGRPESLYKIMRGIEPDDMHYNDFAFVRLTAKR